MKGSPYMRVGVGSLYFGTYSGVDAKNYFQKIFCKWSQSLNVEPFKMKYNYVSNGGSLQGGGWKYHIKYKGQDCCNSFLSMQQAYRCNLTVIAS